MLRWSLGLTVCLVFSLTGCLLGSPNLERDRRTWEAVMTQAGAKWCGLYGHLDQDQLALTYYDAPWVFMQIHRYTNNPKWDACAHKAMKVYRDDYVMGNHGKVPGHWAFPDGLLHSYLDWHEDQGRQALLQLAGTSDAWVGMAYSNAVPSSWIDRDDRIRENSYNLVTKLYAQRYAGWQDWKIPPGDSYAGLWSIERHVTILKKILQRFAAGTADFEQPFMAGLGAKALIAWFDLRGTDPEVLPLLQRLADSLWQTMWKPASGGMLYINKAVESEGGRDAVHPTPDLNLLISPLYAWLYLQTGDVKYRERHDALFSGWVDAATCFDCAAYAGAKQFNQGYWWSFTGLQWRTAAVERHGAQEPQHRARRGK